MAETTNVGAIAFEIVAKTSGIENGMKNAGNSVKTFASSAAGSMNKFEQAISRVEFSQRDAKQTVGTLTRSLGEQGGVVADVVKGVIEMGPAIGIAVGAMAVFNAGVAKAAMGAKLLAESNKLYAESFKSFGERQGMIRQPGAYTAGVMAELEKDRQRIEDMNEKRDAAGRYSEAGVRIGMRVDKTQVIVEQNEILSKLLAPLDRAKEAYQNADFETKYSTSAGTLQRMEEDAHNLTTLFNRMGETLAKLPHTGTDYKNILKEQHDILLNIMDIEDQRTKMLATKNAENISSFSDKIAEAFKKVGKRFKEEADVSKWLNGASGDTDWLFKNPWDKLAKMKKETAKLGFGLQLGNVSVEALQSAATNVQKVSDPESVKQTEILKQINMNTKSGGRVVAVTS